MADKKGTESEVSEKIYLKVAPGTVTSLCHSGAHYEGYDHVFLDGDCSQLGQIAEFLEENGFDLGWQDVHPALKTKDEFKRSLGLIYEYKVAGWYRYKTDLIKYEICTEEQYLIELDIEAEKSRQEREKIADRHQDVETWNL